MRSGDAETILRNLRQAPVRPAAELTGGGPILIVAPHADDETLGCGGLIIEATEAGVPVLIDILTDGARSHPNSRLYPEERLVALRRQEAKQAARTLGLDPDVIRFHDAPDGFLGRDADDADALVRLLARRIDDAGVAAVFVTHSAEPHPDHAAAFALTRRAVTWASSRPALFAYPVWLWAEPSLVALGSDVVAVSRIDISAALALKQQAVGCYRSQLGQVIDDDPTGFSLSDQDLALFLQPYEVFLEIRR